MARSKYSGSKYMKAAQAFGDYQKSVYESISNVDRGREEARAIEEKGSRTQQWFSLAAEGLSTIDKLHAAKETEAKVESAVGGFEEQTGQSVDYSRVSLKDILKGDAKLTDYGKESYNFGGESYTKADMLAYGEKADLSKFDKMLGIKNEGTLVENKGEASGWKYGESSEDTESRLTKETKADALKVSEDDAKVAAGEKRLAERGYDNEAPSEEVKASTPVDNAPSKLKRMSTEERNAISENREWEVGEKSPNLGLPSEKHPDAKFMGDKEGFDLGDLYGENSMFSKLGALMKKPEKERLSEESLKEANVDIVYEDTEELSDSSFEVNSFEEQKMDYSVNAEPSPKPSPKFKLDSIPGDAMAAALEEDDMAKASNRKNTKNKEVYGDKEPYGDTMEKYLDKDWKFGEELDSSKFTLGLSHDKTGKGKSDFSSFNLYDKETGKDYGKMFDVMKSDDSKFGYSLSNKNQSFFGSQDVGGWGNDIWDNRSLQNILQGYNS
jgi:hypothetical protein